jgi:hypothetical protein
VKVLIDQNLSFRLLDALSSRFPGSCHVRDVGLTGDDDERIWRLAKDEGFTFHHSTLSSPEARDRYDALMAGFLASGHPRLLRPTRRADEAQRVAESCPEGMA